MINKGMMYGIPRRRPLVLKPEIEKGPDEDIIKLKLEIEELKKELKKINNKLRTKEKAIRDRELQVEKGWVWS